MSNLRMKIAFTAAHNSLAQDALKALTNQYGQSDIKGADAVVALGGDGQVLKTLYEVMECGKPVFAMRRTESIGFLCNDYHMENLEARIAKAHKVALHPLQIEAVTGAGKKQSGFAINEVSVIRETAQSARLRIAVDGKERIAQYSGDGMLVSTPAGSTAYNHSCGGPIMPLNANTLVMTAISGYRPRRWSYAVLPQDSVVEITALETAKRPVRIEAGPCVISNAASAKIWLDRKKTLTLMFDPDQHLGERIVREQFMM
ncbi:MAG TPA: NAD kinase [Alphaproteobacteria bacterium]|nr:NAD kinase [Alphaproteobacteria bacterium]